MRFVRILAGAAIGLAVISGFAQNETNSASRLPSATPATTNLFAANAFASTNLFPKTNAVKRALGLMEAIRLAVTNNFDVQVERYNPLISAESLEAAKGVYDPALGVTATHSHSKDARGTFSDGNSVVVGLNGELPTGATFSTGINASEDVSRGFSTNLGAIIGTQSSQGKASVASVTQPLLRDMWIDQTRYNIAISRKNLRISELAFRFRVLAIVSQVEQAYFDWIAARENVKVQEEALSLARQQASEYELRTRIGVTKPLDQQRFESQAATSQADLLTAQRNLKQTEITLISLITRQFEGWQNIDLEPADQLPTPARQFEMQESWGRAFAHRPDLHELIIGLEKLGLTEKLDYNRLFPTLNLTGAYGYDASGGSFGRTFGTLADANRPFWSLGLDASIPIGNRTARANLTSARLAKAQADEQLKQARQNIMVQVENAIIDARTDWERIPATRAAREYAASALDAGLKRLAAGTTTSLEILQLQRDLTSARSDEIRTIVDYNKAVTILLEREGTLLDERGLTVNVH